MLPRPPQLPAGVEAHGREVWARCEALTAGLVGELAEQLRLILEPQLASRLAGDYRTGKRINMKKVGRQAPVMMLWWCVCGGELAAHGWSASEHCACAAGSRGNPLSESLAVAAARMTPLSCR